MDAATKYEPGNTFDVIEGTAKIVDTNEILSEETDWVAVGILALVVTAAAKKILDNTA